MQKPPSGKIVNDRSRLKIAVIVNGISRKKKNLYRDLLPRLSEKFSVTVFETQSPLHAIGLAQDACRHPFDVILSAGGDGTLNQVVNGMMQSAQASLPVLGALPFGSGNDFASMLGSMGDADTLMQQLEHMKTRAIDVGKIFCRDEEGRDVEKYFINVCSLGMGPATVRRLEQLPRWTGTGFRYYASVLNTFLTHPTEAFDVRTESWTWQGKARVVAIANGISFGNKIYIAPDSKPDDGIFSTCIATDMALPKFLSVLLKLKSGKKADDERIRYNSASELFITSPGRAYIEAEGEMAGLLPARIVVLKGRIQCLINPAPPGTS
jgi:diacylglycerol kinase (ATP)